jgi:hypothetical protein
MNEEKKNFRDILEVEGVKAKGYGIVPKMAMLDRKLTIEAKAIYSYFCSYAGAGTIAFPSVEKILADLDIGKKRYYKHFNLLKDLGYIEVEQVKSENNKFSHNIYTLVEKPIKKPCSQNDTTGEKDEKPCSRFAYTQIVTTQNDTTNINKSSFKNNNLLYNNQSIYQEDSEVMIDMIDCKKTIKDNIEYPILQQQYGKDSLLDDMVSIMTDTIEDTKNYISFGNEKISSNKVKQRLLELNSMDIQYVIDCFNSTSSKISNPKKYLLKSLYNAKTTQNAYYSNLVNYTLQSKAE